MEAWQLALLAWEGLKLLGVLIGLAASTPAPARQADPASVFYQELAPEGSGFCPRDITGFDLPDPDAHWMVRR